MTRLAFDDDDLLDHQRWLRGTGGQQYRFEGGRARRRICHWITERVVLRDFDCMGGFLNCACFPQSIVERVVFDGAAAHGIEFNDSKLIDCSFIRTGLIGARFRSAKIEGGDWTGAELNESSWTNALVRNVNFRRARLSRSNLSNATFRDCDLRGVDLTGSNLSKARFLRCDLRGSQLDGCTVTGATFSYCGFAGASGGVVGADQLRIKGADVASGFNGSDVIDDVALIRRLAGGDLTTKEHDSEWREGAIFGDWYELLGPDVLSRHHDWLRGAGVGRIELEGANLRGCLAPGVDLRRARLLDCDLSSAYLTTSGFVDAELERCKFDGAVMEDSYLLRARITNCSFVGANLWRTTLGGDVVGCSFVDANLAEAPIGDNVIDCDFRRANITLCSIAYGGSLKASDFRSCNLAGLILKEATVEDCDFRGANMEGLRARDTTFRRCKFAGAVGTPRTRGGVELIDCDVDVEFAPQD